MKQEEIIGKYFTLKYRTKIEAHEYILKIIEKTEDILNFSLEHRISGHFGSLGEEWRGICEIKKGKIIFKTNEIIDWKFTFLDDERYETISDHEKTYIADINIEEHDIKIALQMETQNLDLYKAHPKVELYTSQITQQIIKKFSLDNEYGKYDEPGKYWRISNLIIRNLIERVERKEAELVCEFDLDTVKEEKRVVDSDEVVREHHIANIKFMGYEIIRFEEI